MTGRQENPEDGRCHFCKGSLGEKKIGADFRWGEDLTVIEDVPAIVCSQCGEKYFEASVYSDMEKIASSNMASDHLEIQVINYIEAA